MSKYSRRHGHYLRHAEEIKERSRRYYQLHRPEILIRKRKSQALSKQKKAYDKEYRSRPEVKLRYQKKQSESSRMKRQSIIDILGGKCSNPNCLVPGGCVDFRCLQLDHINGGGKKEIQKFKTGQMMVIYYLKHRDELIKNIQLLCANCNWIKRYEKGETRKARVCL